MVCRIIFICKDNRVISPYHLILTNFIWQFLKYRNHSFLLMWDIIFYVIFFNALLGNSMGCPPSRYIPFSKVTRVLILEAGKYMITLFPLRKPLYFPLNSLLIFSTIYLFQNFVCIIIKFFKNPFTLYFIPNYWRY